MSSEKSKKESNAAAAAATTASAQSIPLTPINERSKQAAGQNQHEVRSEGSSARQEREHSEGSYLYDSRLKTFLGRDSKKWARLAAFYTVFYFCLGCFFTGMLWIFAATLDRHTPRYYNRDSTMSVRTTASLVGMGFRPQPEVDDNLITVSNDPTQQSIMATSLDRFRLQYLTQHQDSKTQECTEQTTAADLEEDTTCKFGWNSIVKTPEHPCSEKNGYGFRNEEPCVLLKFNKIYGWTPRGGRLTLDARRPWGLNRSVTVKNPDVYIACDGSHPSDADVLGPITYYSLKGESDIAGTIPNYYFPYRNAPDHVQPFVLAQFKDLPYNRLISVTCKVWVPSIQHDARTMRGMVTFQLFRTHVEQPS